MAGSQCWLLFFPVLLWQYFCWSALSFSWFEPQSVCPAVHSVLILSFDVPSHRQEGHQSKVHFKAATGQLSSPYGIHHHRRTQSFVPQRFADCSQCRCYCGAVSVGTLPQNCFRHGLTPVSDPTYARHSRSNSLSHSLETSFTCPLLFLYDGMRTWKLPPPATPPELAAVILFVNTFIFNPFLVDEWIVAKLTSYFLCKFRGGGLALDFII